MEPGVRTIGRLIKDPLVLRGHVKPARIAGPDAKAVPVDIVKQEKGYNGLSAGFQNTADLGKIEQGVPSLRWVQTDRAVARSMLSSATGHLAMEPFCSGAYAGFATSK